MNKKYKRIAWTVYR